MNVANALFLDVAPYVGILGEHFATRVTVVASGCWEFSRPRDALGYGRYFRDGKTHWAHRWTYERLVGPIADDLEIDHLCRNTSCCRPDHLEAVTHRENMRRSPVAQAALNARKTHCPQGHPYSPANTLRQRRGKDGWVRRCKICQYAGQKRWARENRERTRSYYWKNREKISERRKQKRMAS